MIDLSKVVPANKLLGEDEEDTALLKEMFGEAERYILNFTWCDKILDKYFGIGIGGVVAVFLFRILSSQEDVDEFVWVIVGDIPPLYITVENASNPACALDGYIGAMEGWIDAVSNGKSLDNLPPVNASPIPENAEKLKKRLQFIDKEILSYYQNDLV